MESPSRRGKVREEYKASLDALIAHTPVKQSDLDQKAMMLLDALQRRGRAVEACDHLRQALDGMERERVSNWRAYIYTLLRKFDEAAYQEMKAAGGQEGGGAGAAGGAAETRLRVRRCPRRGRRGRPRPRRPPGRLAAAPREEAISAPTRRNLCRAFTGTGVWLARPPLPTGCRQRRFRSVTYRWRSSSEVPRTQSLWPRLNWSSARLRSPARAPRATTQTNASRARSSTRRDARTAWTACSAIFATPREEAEE